MSRATTVLVVDDDLAVRLRIGDLLARAGDFILHEAVDGAAGLSAATAVRPDLILLDIMMPGLTGYEVCAALRADARTREIPVIVLSAAEESEAMVAALEAGADDFLRKPFSAPELRAKVRTIAKLNRFRALAAERDRFRWLLDRSLEPLVIADADGALVYANERAREIFGLGTGTGGDIAEAVGRHFRTEPPEAWRERRGEADGGFALFQPETPQVPARWFDAQAHALAGEAGETLFKFTDRSGTVRRELETFTFQHLIAHKIRTPLNGLSPIFTFLEASEDAALDAGTAELLHVARESADRLEATLTGILAYHDAVFGARRPSAAPAGKPLAVVVASAAEAAGLAGRVTFAGPAGTLLPAEATEVALTEVFENCAKFGAAGEGGVAATLAAVDARWELRLHAPGPGLPPDVVAQLGRPYGQLERKFSGEVPGMGLGLATVRALLRSVGGDIVFANHAGGFGLVTTLHLPFVAFQPDHAGKYITA